MADTTNYTVLSLVAIVALTAIVAMFIAARPAELGVATVSGNSIFSLSLTGRVTAEAPVSEPEPNNYLDLNDNGKIDAADAEILGLVIDRVQFCPRNKRCDVDGNTVIDMSDLGALNALIVQERAAVVEPIQPVYAPSPSGQSSDLLAASLGVIA